MAEKSAKVNVALIVSILALVFTGLNFYYNNLRVYNKLEAQVAEYSLLKNDSTKLGDSLIIRVLYINKGNKISSIEQPWFDLADSSGNVYVRSTVLTKRNFPIILEAGKSLTVDYRIPFSFLAKENPGGGNQVNKCKVRLQLNARDYNFIPHNVPSSYIVEINYSNTEIVRLKDLPNSSFLKLPIIRII